MDKIDFALELGKATAVNGRINIDRYCKVLEVVENYISNNKCDNMKLYILRPKDNLPKDDNPWIPWFDKCFGFVIRAASEADARRIADANAGDENRFSDAKTKNPWLDSNYSTCEELGNDGEESLVLRDFASA
jgi:hypothetical protein